MLEGLPMANPSVSSAPGLEGVECGNGTTPSERPSEIVFISIDQFKTKISVIKTAKQAHDPFVEADPVTQLT